MSPGLEQRQVDGHVGVGAGVGLHVGVRRAEQRLGPLAGDVLDLVDDLVAAVVALARVALAVLVGEHRAGGPQHGRRGEVLAGDQLEGGVLALDLAVDERRSTSSSGFCGQGIGQLLSSVSMSAIWATRRSWRPPSNGVASQSSRISVGQPVGDDAAAHGQHVGVVVLAAQAGGEEVVAQRGPHAVDLVGGDLLALARAAEHDAAVGLARDDGAADRGADRRVVDRLGAVGAEVERPRGRGARARRRGAPSGRRRRGRHRWPPSRAALLRARRPRRAQASATSAAEQVVELGRP